MLPLTNTYPKREGKKISDIQRETIPWLVIHFSPFLSENKLKTKEKDEKNTSDILVVNSSLSF